MRYFFILFLFAISLLGHQKDLDVSYKISYGIFGKLGIAKASIKIDENSSYKISIEAEATGLASILSLGKEEKYISEGKFIDNLFIPKIYIKESKNLLKQRIDTHIFDYDKKTIFKNRVTHKQVDGNWTRIENNSTLEYFTKNDILTLFFNIKHFITDFKEPKSYNFKALGASNDTGEIDIVVPDDGSKFMKVYIHQKIFSSNNGELLVHLREDGICDEAILKDVLFFGDITGEIIER